MVSKNDELVDMMRSEYTIKDRITNWIPPGTNLKTITKEILDKIGLIEESLDPISVTESYILRELLRIYAKSLED